MSTLRVRPLRPSRFRRAAARDSVETLLSKIERLTGERQLLRERRASGRALERNRVKLARAQRELSRALIERHLHVETHRAA